MQFTEQKIEHGQDGGGVHTEYEYKTVDIFGEVIITSSTKLGPEMLDDIVHLLLTQNVNAETIKGEVKHKDGVVRYTFKRAPQWSDDNEDEEICSDTPTSTQRPDIGFTPIGRFADRAISWCARFVAAFREAWKNGSVKK